MSAQAASYATSGQPTLKTIRLGGELGKRFGRLHRFAVDTPAEALRAMCVLIDGFETFLRESPLKYKVFLDRQGVRDAETELVMNRSAQQYAVMPVIQGAKSGGALQMIAGAVLTVVGLVVGYFTGGNYWNPITQAGVMMMIGGAVQMLFGPRAPSVQESNASNNPSYYFNGPVNTASQGQCVPVGYGEMLVGSAVISAAITTVDIPIQ